MTEKQVIVDNPKNWVVLRRGTLVYVATDETNAYENVLFDYETVCVVTDEQLYELEQKSEFFNQDL